MTERRVVPFEKAKRGGGTDLTQDDLALLFQRSAMGSYLYDRHAGDWYRFEGFVWRADRKHVVVERIRKLTRENGSGKKGELSAGFVFGAEQMARSALSISRVEWDSARMLLNTPEGTIDLVDGFLREPSAADRITKAAGVAPAKGKPTRWLQFLHDATLGDDELIGYLKRACGYMLTGDVREHALFFIYGPGGNGKSVFANVLRHILGDYAVVADMSVFTAQKHQGHSTNVAMLAGSRAVFASETNEGEAWDEQRIKGLTGADPITARFMRQDNFTFDPTFKVCIIGNHAPVLKTVDDAMRRRFHIIPFTNKPARPDPLLEARILQDEAKQVLAWMIEGAVEWQNGGLRKPERVRVATEEYLTGQDILSEWMESELRVEKDNEFLFAASKELFQSWKSYAFQRGEEVGTAKSLGMRMLNLGFKNVRKVGSRGFQGVQVMRSNYDHDA